MFNAVFPVVYFMNKKNRFAPILLFVVWRECLDKITGRSGIHVAGASRPKVFTGVPSDPNFRSLFFGLESHNLRLPYLGYALNFYSVLHANTFRIYIHIHAYILPTSYMAPSSPRRSTLFIVCRDPDAQYYPRCRRKIPQRNIRIAFVRRSAATPLLLRTNTTDLRAVCE